MTAHVCSYCSVMAREGRKDRHQNGNTEKATKLSAGLGTECGEAVATVVVLDQHGKTLSTEGY